MKCPPLRQEKGDNKNLEELGSDPENLRAAEGAKDKKEDVLSQHDNESGGEPIQHFNKQKVEVTAEHKLKTEGCPADPELQTGERNENVMKVRASVALFHAATSAETSPHVQLTESSENEAVHGAGASVEEKLATNGEALQKERENKRQSAVSSLTQPLPPKPSTPTKQMGMPTQAKHMGISTTARQVWPQLYAAVLFGALALTVKRDYSVGLPLLVLLVAVSWFRYKYGV